MENVNFCLIWNYNFLVVRKLFEANLVKKIDKKKFKVLDAFISEILRVLTDIKSQAYIYSIEELTAQSIRQN